MIGMAKLNFSKKQQKLIREIELRYVEAHDKHAMKCIDEVLDLVLNGFNKKSQELYKYVEIFDQQFNYNEEAVIRAYQDFQNQCLTICEVDVSGMIYELLNDDFTNYHYDAINMLQRAADELCELPFFTGVEQVRCIHTKLVRTCQKNSSRYFKMKLDEFENELNQELLKAQHAMEAVCSKYGVILVEGEEKNVNDVEQEAPIQDAKNGIVRVITNRNELRDLVIRNGYKFKSQNGSHRKYENAEGQIVIIPIHAYDIGKGLSCKIQKEIFKNNNK